ncbi:molecular chaperone DnaK [Actinomadura rubrobrunea]|uniref:Molecular chaperone DnaK n=1 Tax=Actinomadura rubrobrunea TaxID=115335 RepID=A0A9W6PRR0_9ACTN|nr:Hsp70 family protein [Actinomadura rubrobrunea]GLW61884.1 molecular chaperone DnaK [Actinomadura rubrobrunea]
MTAFGIDLGTTNSCIAYVDEEVGRPVVVPNAVGENTTPSVVYFERRGRVVVGDAAKDAALLAPHLTVQLVKRQMGRDDVTYPFHGETYTPETVSALILKELADGARRRLGRPVEDVVITVPAYFGVAEREATRRAGEIAGLTVLDVLAEPVAAALSRQDHKPVEGARHVLVYDLGGGTFDTTVIRMDGEDVQVLCTGGDRELGGADWDARVRDYLVGAFTERHPRLDPTADEEFMQDVWIKAEKIKRELSTAVSRRCNLRFAGAVAQVELTRERLEELTADLLERTLTITERTVEKARAQGAPRIDEVILVGGMSRMPAVAARLEELVGTKPWRHEPDLAVARGAALFAMIRRVQKEGADRSAEQVADRLGITAAQAESMRNRRVTTVVPRGFGVKVIDHNDPRAATDPMRARYYIVHLLPADTPLPADTGPVTFFTAFDNQPGLEVEVWEQNGPESSEELADNTLIGRGKLRDLPPRLPKGTPIQITFSMNETGLLTVAAVEPRSGRNVRFDLQIGGMDRKDVDKAKAAVARHEIIS